MSIARTASWLALGRLARGAVGLLIPVVLVRTLSVSDYGVFKQVDLVAALLLPFLVVGFDKSITYFVPRKEADPASEVTTPLFAMVLVSLAFLTFAVFSPATFGRVFGAVEFRLLAVTVVAAAGASGIRQLGTRALLAVGSGRTAAALPLLVGVPRALAIVLAAVSFRTIDAILVVCIVAAMVEALAIGGLLCWRGCLRLPLRLEVLARHMRFGGPLGAVSALSAWAGRIDRYLVSGAYGPEVFAIYAVGKTRVPFLRTLPFAIGDATAPQFSRLDSEGRHAEMGTLWRKRAEALLPLYVLMAGFLAATAGWVIPIVFTDAYVDAVPVFRVFAGSLVLQAVGGLDLVLRALAALRFLIASVIVSLVVRTVVCVAVLQLESLALLAAVQTLASFAVFLARLLYVRRRLGVRWSVLLPHRGMGRVGAFLVLGLVWTWAMQAVLGDRSAVALGASAALWAPLIALTIWRQGLWRGLAPRRKS